MYTNHVIVFFPATIAVETNTYYAVQLWLI